MKISRTSLLSGNEKRSHISPLSNMVENAGNSDIIDLIFVVTTRSFWVRIMKRRVRTVAMPFLLSVLVLCLSKHCMLVQLLREKIAALSI